jgi:hypothetical protein
MPWWLYLIIGIVILLILAIAVLRTNRWYHSHETRQKLVSQCAQVNSFETIFVMIPSYRDPECAQTVYDLFLKAYCPYRVFVGVCDQINIGAAESDCRTRVKHLLSNTKRESGFDLSCFDHNLRVLVLPAHEAQGPMFARAQIENNLYRGEMFIMCIDSHMVMVKDWDKKAIAQLRRCQVNSDIKPILTMHPDTWTSRNTAQLMSDESFEQGQDREWYDERPARYLCAGKVQRDSGLIELASRSLARIPVRPLQQSFYSPCFSFTYASAHKDVPMDPNCSCLFGGEEISLSVRFWTCGWDFYVPFTMLCLHKSDRSYRPTFWELRKSSVKAEKRIQAMIGVRPINSIKQRSLTEDIDVGQKYGPGTVRSVQDYERFAGVDFANCKASKRAVMGIVNETDSVEVLSKYGSNEAFIFTERNCKEVKFRNH